MGATAALTITATASGLPEGGVDQLSIALSNTSAANEVRLIEVTTALGTANGVNPRSSALYVLLIPPATNTFNWRLTNSTAEVGLAMSSRGAALLSVNPTGSTIHFYTTGGTTFTMRYITY